MQTREIAIKLRSLFNLEPGRNHIREMFDRWYGFGNRQSSSGTVRHQWPMKIHNLILVADRNPHIRRYLARELRSPNCDVIPVESMAQLRQWILSQRPMDLLILDPNLPEDGVAQCLEALLKQIPTVPIIIHSLPGDASVPRIQGERFTYIEKNGTSANALKADIKRLFTSEMGRLTPNC